MFSTGSKMRSWLMVAVVVGTVGALPATTPKDAEALMKIFTTEVVGRNSAIENIIINVLEDLRQTMVTGSGGVPVLDPFQLDQLALDDNTIPLPGFRVEVRDVLVSKLSTFEMKQVSVTSQSIILQRYNMLVELHVPQLDVSAGFYDLLVSYAGINLFGSGDANIVLKGLDMGVDALVGLRLGLGTINLNIINLRVLGHLDDISINLTGMFNSPEVDSFINLFLETLVMELQAQYSDEIFDVISPIVQDVANDILSDINLIDLIGS